MILNIQPVFKLLQRHKTMLFRVEFMCAIAFIIFFFFPWITLLNSKTLAGYQMLHITTDLREHISLSGELFCYLVYLLPILSMTMCISEILGKRNKMIIGMTGILPLGFFAYYEYLKYFASLVLVESSTSLETRPWWNPFKSKEVMTITPILGDLEVGAYLTLFTAVILLIALMLDKSQTSSQTEILLKKEMPSFRVTCTRILFGEWNHLRRRQITGLFFGIAAIGCFTMWNVPKVWQDAPAWSRWMFIPFGEMQMVRFPSLLATILSLCVIISLSQRRFIDCHVDNVFGMLSLLVNSWSFALVIELVMGRMDRFFEGGISSFLLVTLYALSLLGIREVVPFAMGGIVVLLMIQLIAAEEKLFIPGYFGAITLFLSLALQFQEFLPQLHLLSSVHHNQPEPKETTPKDSSSIEVS